MIRTAGTDVPSFRPEDDDPRPNRPAEKTRSGLGARIDAFLTSPFAGIAPWALMSVLAGPGRFEIAVGAALGLSLLVMLVSRARGIGIHLLEVFGATVFAVMTLVGALASQGLIDWLELWAGELVNVSLAAFAWTTLLIGRPFTTAYAKESTPREHWESPLFKRINNVITAVWAGAFTFAASVGLVGDLFFHDAGNFWTGWILQLAAIFFAVAFTEFYPDHASAAFELANGRTAQKPSVVQVVAWIPTFVVVTGVAGLVTGALDVIVGIALIVGGGVCSSILAKMSPAAESQAS